MPFTLLSPLCSFISSYSGATFHSFSPLPSLVPVDEVLPKHDSPVQPYHLFWCISTIRRCRSYTCCNLLDRQLDWLCMFLQHSRSSVWPSSPYVAGRFRSVDSSLLSGAWSRNLATEFTWPIDNVLGIWSWYITMVFSHTCSYYCTNMSQQFMDPCVYVHGEMGARSWKLRLIQ